MLHHLVVEVRERRAVVGPSKNAVSDPIHDRVIEIGFTASDQRVEGAWFSTETRSGDGDAEFTFPFPPALAGELCVPV